jgi:hypothetical protein
MPDTLSSIQDPYQDPSYQRACLQNTHYREQYLHFLHHLIINSTKPGSERLLVLNDENGRSSRFLSELEAADIRQFCYKDCAIYGNAENLGGVTPLRIFEEVYKEWFPHRAKDQDLKRGNFFGKYMGSNLPYTFPLPDLISFHTRLYEKIESMEHEAIQKRNFMCRYPPEPQRGLYQMRDTFAFVFIVLDKTNWREDGVLLVFKNRDDIGEFHIEGTETEMDDVAPAVLYRTSFKFAMKAVVSYDAERSKKNKEWHDDFEVYYGSDDE